jgi:hypothetical protein
LGIYGGDDGLTINIQPSRINSTFAKLGLLAKSESLPPHSVIPFLGRWYIDPWTTRNSCIDIERQLRKLHLTTSPADIPTEVVLLRKALGYYQTDTNTPILTNWSKLIFKLYPDLNLTEYQIKMTNKDISYWAKFETPFDPLTDDEYKIAIKHLAEILEMTPNEIQNTDIVISTAKNLTDLDRIILNPTIKTELEVTIKGSTQSGKKADHQEGVKLAKLEDKISKPANSKFVTNKPKRPVAKTTLRPKVFKK